MNRRLLLKTGAGMVAVLAGGGALWANTRTPIKALAPWDQAGQTLGDVRLDCLAYAILAPSPHNRQPWRVEFSGADRMQLYCDLSRRLPHTDPYDRQITIGLGCFLELLKLSAGQKGYKLDTQTFPDGQPAEMSRLDTRPIASIRFVKADVVPDPLFDAILTRRSHKQAFDTQKRIEPAILNEVLAIESTGGSVDRPKVDKIKDMLYQGMAVEFSTRHTLKESADLMRLGKAEIEASPDGIDLGGPMMELLIAAGMINKKDLSDPDHQSVKDYLARTKNIYDTSQGIVWQTTNDNSRTSQLEAGARYVRLHLKASQLGLALQPISQTLQEYPEMASLYQDIHTELGVSSPQRLQMLARIGYAGMENPSPRWSAETILTRHS